LADLPALDRISMELLETAGEEPPQEEALIRILSRNPALAGRLLNLLNSPAYPAPGRLTGLRQAMALLGAGELRDLALALGLLECAAGQGGAGRSPHGDRLRIHSLTVGLLAENMSLEELGLGRGFLALGLVHDLGKILLAVHRPLAFGRVLESLAATGRPWPEAEQETLGFDHAQLGQALLDHWGLGRRWSLAVGWHHQPWVREEPSVEAGVLFLAELLVKMIGHWSFEPESKVQLRRILTLRAVAFLTQQGWLFEGRLLDRLRTRLMEGPPLPSRP
jgi:HD-like signal output (HDOD) protein